MTTFLILYMYGLVAAVGLLIIRLILDFIVSRLYKGNIYDRNLNRLGIFKDPVDGKVIFSKPEKIRYVFSFTVCVIFSWLNVVISAYDIIRIPFFIFSSALNKSQDLNDLYFPLRNNPNLEIEVIWARLFVGSMIVTGQQPTIEQIQNDILTVVERVSHFNSELAITHLRNLNRVKALDHLDDQKLDKAI